MILIVNVTIPRDQARIVLDPFLKLPKLAGNVIRRGPYLRTDDDGRLYVMTLYEFDSSLEKEAETYLRRRYKTFLEIDRLSLDVNKWYAGKEAIQALGLGR